MRQANVSLKKAIAEYEKLDSYDLVYTIREFGNKLGVSRNTIVRWDSLGYLKLKHFDFNGCHYRYLTEDQYFDFLKSDFYISMNGVFGNPYVEISRTVHDLNLNLSESIYTVKEIAAKIGISIQTVNRYDKNGVFVANRVTYNNRIYKYYTESQYVDFINSDVYKNLNSVRNSDLLGTDIGKLKVVSFSESAVSKGYYGSYICECDCGNVVELARSELMSGKHLSCGCRFHDLTGRDFGFWHVDSIASCSYTKCGSKLFRYNCTCRCGTKRIVIARSLTSGRSMSCGCVRDIVPSKGELYVRKYLDSIGFVEFVDYSQYKTYPDLKGIGGGNLSYDFYIELGDGRSWLIEYQGGQHYFPVSIFGGDFGFEKQQEHDRRKREYAINLGIDLIEIPYNMDTYESISIFLKSHGIE